MSKIKEKYSEFLCSEEYGQYCLHDTKSTYQEHLQACYDDLNQSMYLRTSKRSKAVVVRLNKEQKVK